MSDDWTALILSGGRGKRLGGAEKSEITVNGRTLLDSVIDGLPTDVPIVVCGPATETNRPVQFCREDPPFTGPLAAIAEGIEQVTTPIVVVIAVDMPRSAPIASRLADIVVGHIDVDGVVPTDADGHPQWLCSAFRVEPLRRALHALPIAHGAVRDLRHHLRILELHEPDFDESLRDIDTVADLRTARQMKGDDPMLEAWVTSVKDELGLSVEQLDIDRLLDLARVAAHNIDRPAAPLTTFLAGIAVGSGQSLDDVAARIEALAQGWKDDNHSE